jgi:SulP family sulfate permease
MPPKLTRAMLAGQAQAPRLARHLPFLEWGRHYRRQDLPGDVTAGLVVAVMLVPQGMAYALLVGLPPQMGLYASIAPLIIYGLLGTSRTLSVGPAAIVALLVASGVGQLAPESSAQYLTLVLLLTFMAGCLQLLLGLARLGFLVNFLSHPVITGFTSAAALVIIFSQLPNLLGVTPPEGEAPYQSLLNAFQNITGANLVTLGLGCGGIAILVYFKALLRRHLAHLSISLPLLEAIPRGGPLVVVVSGTLLVWGLGLHQQASVSVVGQVPAGLPSLTVPELNWASLRALLPTALAISLIGFMESIAVAKAMAIRRRQKIEANQELVALGSANLGAAFTSGFPVAGGLSRSMVNFTAGANTGLASIITALLIILTVLLLVPLFFFLPQVALAAIIVVGVVELIDLGTFKRVWRYSKADAGALLITFGGTFAVSVEVGILAGVITALALYLWRTSRPQIAIVGRVEESEHFRNISRFRVTTYPQILAVRVDESLYFANTRYLEDTLLRMIADHPDVKHLVLIGSGINYIDASGLETLENLMAQLRKAGVNFYLAEIKGPVLEQLRRVGFLDHLGAERIFVTTHLAMQALTQGEQPQIRYDTIMTPTAHEDS